MKRIMHNYIPPTPFRAEVKIYSDVNNNDSNKMKLFDESLEVDGY
jgi:hypothetical protein